MKPIQKHIDLTKMIEHLDFGCLRTDNPLHDAGRFWMGKVQTSMESPTCWTCIVLTLFVVIVVCNMVIGYKFHLNP